MHLCECLAGTTCPYVYPVQCWHDSNRQMVWRRRQKERWGPDMQRGESADRRQRRTSFLYGLDQADEGQGGRLWWCELLAQVRHRNSWNNNTNHCCASGTEPPHPTPTSPLKGHRRALPQLTRSSWRRGAWIIKVCTKSTRNTVKHHKVDIGVHFTRGTPVLERETWQLRNSFEKCCTRSKTIAMHVGRRWLEQQLQGSESRGGGEIVWWWWAKKPKKLYLLHDSPQTRSNIFSALEKEQRRKQRGGDPTFPLLFSPFSFLFSPLARSPPLRSVPLGVSP